LEKRKTFRFFYRDNFMVPSDCVDEESNVKKKNQDF